MDSELLFNEEGGIVLTTAVVLAYSIYLANNILSQNPNGVYNSTLGSEDISSIVISLVLTIVSLAWMGWSRTAKGVLILWIV